MKYFLSFLFALAVFSAGAPQVLDSFSTPYDEDVKYYFAIKDDGSAVLQITDNILEFETTYTNLVWSSYTWEGDEQIVLYTTKGDTVIGWTRVNKGDLWYATVDGDNVLVIRHNFVSLN